VADGSVDSITSFNRFESILGNATSLSTGYVQDEKSKIDVVADVITQLHRLRT